MIGRKDKGDNTHQALEDVLTDYALGRSCHLQREVLVLGVDVRPEKLHSSLQAAARMRRKEEKNPVFMTFAGGKTAESLGRSVPYLGEL